MPASTQAIADSIGVAPVGAVLGTGTLEVLVVVRGADEVGAADEVTVRDGIGVSVGWLLGADEQAGTPPANNTAAAVRTAIRMPQR